MHRERVSDNVYWFQSDVYAQVTAGAVAGPQWAVVIDTLALPDETLGMREFIEHELGDIIRRIRRSPGGRLQPLEELDGSLPRCRHLVPASLPRLVSRP